MFNNITLIGRIKQDIRVIKVGHGIQRSVFKLVVARNYLNNRGIREVDDFDCVIWNTAAKNLAKKTTQGSLVLVNGTLQKNKKNKLEILVEEFSVLEFKPIKTGQQLKEPPKIAEVN